MKNGMRNRVKIINSWKLRVNKIKIKKSTTKKIGKQMIFGIQFCHLEIFIHYYFLF